MKRTVWGLLFGIGLLAITSSACESDSLWLGSDHGALRPVADCADLEGVLKRNAREQMRQSLRENLEWALQYGGCMYWDGDYLAGAGDPNAGPDRSSQETGAKDYSTTNTQEDGVDESDFIKNDGNTIFLLAGHELRIYDAYPPPATHLLSATEISGKPRSLFVRDGKAVIYSDLVDENWTWDDCYYDGWYYGCYGPPRHMQITVLDLSDLAQPLLEREIVLNGAYTNSRRIGPAVHTVVTFQEIAFPGVRYWPDDLWDCNMNDMQILLAFLRLERQNERIIEETQLSDWLPAISDTRYSKDGRPQTDETLLQDCKNFYEPVLPAGHSFLTVLSFDMAAGSDLNLASIVGQRGEVYASMDSLYVATNYWGVPGGLWSFPDDDSEGEATVIHKFSLDNEGAAAQYAASGVVRGRILNQFSMGEFQGLLRLATTSGWVRNPETHNAVFVLEQQGQVLQTIGSLTGIAPSEDIRSARFVGERGFIVTFKKTDPLFAIDLSDPRQPVLAGELKIPGFSTYIHMMDADHLLTIGFDADDQGDFAWFQGIQLQIFDVSDMTKPTRTHLTTIGTRGSSSEATANHLAFNYFPPKDVLALPMAICDGTSGGSSYGEMSFTGLMVWDLTTAAGFSERGRVAHLPPDGQEDPCHNWWTNPASRVKRSVIMDDWVFSISDNLMKVNHLDDLATDLLTLDLPTIPQDDPYYGW